MQMHKLHKRELEQAALSNTGIRFQPEIEKDIDLSVESLSPASKVKDRENADNKHQSKED